MSARGNPRKLGNMDTVGPVCAARYDAMQEDHAVTLFEHIHASTENAREMIGQGGQLMEVRGEEGAATEARRIVQVLHDGAGDGQSIPGRRAATDLVEQDQTPGRSVVQDVGQLEHLHHESRLTGGNVIMRPDPGEDAIDEADPSGARRHERADLGHEYDQRGLSQPTALAGHVRAGKDGDTPFAVIEHGVVRHELAGWQ